MIARQFEPVDEGKNEMSIEDKFAMKQLEESVRWDESVGKYRCGLPWRHGREHAAKILNALDSGRMALDRLKRSTHRMRREPQRRQIIFDTVQKFVDEGRVVDVSPEEQFAVDPRKPRWTLPIHIAPKPGKPNQVRVCHDAKAKVHGVSLNDMLLDGPDIGSSIVGIIMRFRAGGEVALGADIKGFYHEVFIDEMDEGVFRYWWFKCQDMNRIELKRFLGHAFGVRSSGLVATFCLRHHILSNQAKYPREVVLAVLLNFYVDDLI